MQGGLTAKLQHFAQSEAVRNLQASVEAYAATWTLPQETLRNLNEAVETARRTLHQALKAAEPARRTLHQTLEAMAPLAGEAGAVIRSLQDARDNLFEALRPLLNYLSLVGRHLAQGVFFRGRAAKRGGTRIRFRRLPHERVLKLFFVYLQSLRRGKTLNEALKAALKALSALLILVFDLIRLTHEPQKTLSESYQERAPPKDPTQNLTRSLVIAPVAPPLAA